MPCHSCSSISNNPRRWEACRQEVSKAMIEAGWNKHSSKFDGVMHKKALKLFHSKG